MKRSILGLGLSLVFACSCFSGCELLDREKRARSEDLAQVNEHDHGSDHNHDHEDSASKVGAVESKPDPGFFKGGRLSGGWSSDARDIERNLGVQ